MSEPLDIDTQGTPPGSYEALSGYAAVVRTDSARAGWVTA